MTDAEGGSWSSRAWGSWAWYGHDDYGLVRSTVVDWGDDVWVAGVDWGDDVWVAGVDWGDGVWVVVVEWDDDVWAILGVYGYDYNILLSVDLQLDLQALVEVAVVALAL